MNRNRKKLRSFYSKLLKYSFPRGAIELGTNYSVVRNTLESSLEKMRIKGWDIHLNLKEKRKNFNPICYIECGIDYRPRGGVAMVVTLSDVKPSCDTEVKDLSELLRAFQENAVDVPARGEDIEYLHEEAEAEAWQ